MLYKKILVFGKNGQLGRAFQEYFANRNNIVFISRDECDLTDPKQISECLQKFQPNIIVNASAYTAVDQAEKDIETSQKVNALAPKMMAEYIQSISNGVLLHYSTDYVFDGSKNSTYIETDQTNPLGQYGKSKLSGEQAIQSVFEDHSNTSAKYYILRTSWVYGDGGNFIKTMLRLAQERDQIKVISDQYGVPTSAKWLAQIGIKTISSEASSGIYHAVVDGEISWHSLAKYVIKTARDEGIKLKILPEAIQAIPATDYPLPAPRPYNSRMNNQKLKDALKQEAFPKWQDQVQAYVKKLITN